MKDIAAIVIAAGRGTRMKSDFPKVLQNLHSRPLLGFLIKSLDQVGIVKKLIVANARDEDTIKNIFDNIDTVIQKEPLGSGDAVRHAENYFAQFKGDILVLCGDIPFIRRETIEKLVNEHRKEKSSCTLLTARVDDPSSYGRILRDADGNVLKIVEETDISIYEEVINEINVGCYCFNKDDLFKYAEALKQNPKKGEYYLTDIIEILKENGKKISSVTCSDSIEYLGINSRLDLAVASDIIRRKTLDRLMLRGVTITDPNSTFVDMDTNIGRDTMILPYTIIEKKVTIGARCTIGPFARIRENTTLNDNVEIGNFVELVRTKVCSGTKIKHMSYIGDAEIGKNVNVGAGTITANYDGKKKHKTIIEDGAFIGVGSILIAPVKIGRGAVVGAGSVVTKRKDVPPNQVVVGVPARILRTNKESRNEK